MARLARALAAVLLLTALTGAIGVWIGLPYVERRWNFFPVKDVPENPWELPDGAVKVEFSAADGVRLRGWFLKAKSPPNGITVLVLHGNFGILPDYMPGAQSLRQRGFNILLFNYRGFGLSDGTTLGEATIDLDAAAAQHYLTKERGIDPLSIVFLGVSLGGAVAAHLATWSPCRTVVLISASASAKRQAQLDRPWIPEFVLDHLSSPFDTVDRVGRAKCPVLVIHGADDYLVPLAHAQEVYDAARPPKRFIVVPVATHGLGDPESLSSYLDAPASFVTHGP